MLAHAAKSRSIILKATSTINKNMVKLPVNRNHLNTV